MRRVLTTLPNNGTAMPQSAIGEALGYARGIERVLTALVRYSQIEMVRDSSIARLREWRKVKPKSA
jgi:hypothetical protein